MCWWHYIRDIALAVLIDCSLPGAESPANAGSEDLGDRSVQRDENGIDLAKPPDPSSHLATALGFTPKCVF
jgi:hypothetical protein